MRQPAIAPQVSPPATTATLEVVVLGMGAWGSTLAHLLRAKGHRVQVWSRRLSDRPTEMLTQAQLIISAISAKGVAAVVEQIHPAQLRPDAIVVSATKGLIPDSMATTDWPQLPSQMWATALPDHAVAVLSGPNLAQEIQEERPAATVVASADRAAAAAVQLALSSRRFRVYTNADVLGVELGGTLKNVIAIAVGACEGLQLGTNAKAALITRGLAEIIRIGSVWGAAPQTFYGLSGIGDLMATCNSPLSRNYQVGYGIAQGRSLADVLTTLKGTAEGINTSQILVELAARQQISLPITQQVHQLLHGETTPQQAVEALMLRHYKPEMDIE